MKEKRRERTMTGRRRTKGRLRTKVNGWSTLSAPRKGSGGSLHGTCVRSLSLPQELNLIFCPKHKYWRDRPDQTISFLKSVFIPVVSTHSTPANQHYYFPRRNSQQNARHGEMTFMPYSVPHLVAVRGLISDTGYKDRNVYFFCSSFKALLQGSSTWKNGCSSLRITR